MSIGLHELMLNIQLHNANKAFLTADLIFMVIISEFRDEPMDLREKRPSNDGSGFAI
jgi:hypothetical protein